MTRGFSASGLQLHRKTPRFLSWSPSGDQIAYSRYSAEQGLGTIGILEIRTGKLHQFGRFSGELTNEIRWSANGHALYANYWRTGSNWGRGQLGFLSSSGGDIQPITRDTNTYRNLTLSADGKTIATVLSRSYGSIYVLSEGGSGFGEAQPVLSQANEFTGDGGFDSNSGINWSAGVSSDGKTLAIPIASTQNTESEYQAKITLFTVGSQSPPRMLDATHYSSNAQFTPDGKSVAYANRENGVDNIWVQPVDGSAGHLITNFKSEQIWSFGWSPDGKSLGIMRGHFDSDVVLLQESKL